MADEFEGETAYAKKRRMLTGHRVNMRIMDGLIEDNGLGPELEERLIERTGNTNFWLGYDNYGLDETSGDEDPQAEAEDALEDLREERQDAESFVQAVKGAAENRTLVLALERASMQREDALSRLARK